MFLNLGRLLEEEDVGERDSFVEGGSVAEGVEALGHNTSSRTWNAGNAKLIKLSRTSRQSRTFETNRLLLPKCFTIMPRIKVYCVL